MRNQIEKLGVAALKAKLAQRSLPTEGLKQVLRARLGSALSAEAGAAVGFVDTHAAAAGASSILRCYFKNEHVLAQAKIFADMTLIKHQGLKLIFMYDNALSHKKVGGARRCSHQTRQEGRMLQGGAP